jgi:hypothetical protein
MRRWSVALQSLMPGQPTAYASLADAESTSTTARQAAERGSQVRARACKYLQHTVQEACGSESHPCAESAVPAPSCAC